MKGKEIEELISKQLLEDYDRLYRVAFSYVHNQEDAMDIVQESAYKAIKSSHKVREASYVSSWIYRIVINTSLDFIKKNKKVVVGVEEYMGKYVDKYTDFDLENTLNALDEKERTVIVLRFFEDMKLSEIAKITEENINTVKTRLYRALDKLKVELNESERCAL